MKYSVNNIQFNEGENKFLFFWGHHSNKDGVITKSCFSQWWQCEFKIDDVTYQSAEHYMMAEKARLFNDIIILEKIILCKTPSEAKKLGRRVRNFDNDVWENARYNIVKKGNYYKFSQNEKMKNFLINSKKRFLVEASPVDSIWGIGMAHDHKDVANPSKWRGLNLLGFVLMEVRDELLAVSNSLIKKR